MSVATGIYLLLQVSMAMYQLLNVLMNLLSGGCKVRVPLSCKLHSGADSHPA